MFKFLGLNNLCKTPGLLFRPTSSSLNLKLNALFSTPYKTFAVGEPVYASSFHSTASGDPGRKQRGIWQGKNHKRGCKVSYSDHRTIKKLKVNVTTKRIYSEVLKKQFFLKLSMRALRTIKKYGGLDNYLLKSNDKLIKDSQLAQVLKKTMLKKKEDPNYIPGYLPFTRKPRFTWKKREPHEVRELPSIYIPPEAKRTDLSEMYYPVDFFETRVEKEKRKEIERKLEQESDPVKRDELRSQLDTGKYAAKVKKDMLTLMPIRHKWIRDTLVRIKERPTAKLHFLKTLEQSENYTKLMLNEQYKHFSEDYPEVQLILQQTEQDKVRKNKLLGKMYKEYVYDFGETYDVAQKALTKGFEPFDKKQGRMWDQPEKRMNAKMEEKLKERHAKKTKKLNQKKRERKVHKNSRKVEESEH